MRLSVILVGIVIVVAFLIIGSRLRCRLHLLEMCQLPRHGNSTFVGRRTRRIGASPNRGAFGIMCPKDQDSAHLVQIRGGRTTSQKGSPTLLPKVVGACLAAPEWFAVTWIRTRGLLPATGNRMTRATRMWNGFLNPLIVGSSPAASASYPETEGLSEGTIEIPHKSYVCEASKRVQTR
jgi:hypothetical protein